MTRVNIRTLGAALCVTGTLLGATACEEYDVVDDQPVAEVAVEPPPPQVEVVPAVPYAGAVWVGGRWVWHGGRHVWLAGRYVRPRRGYVYQPHVWVRSGNRWRYTPGRWHRH